jgi:hypothetical protein
VFRIIYLLLLSLLLVLPAAAQSTPYDNLKLLGVGSKLTDEQGATLSLMAFHTKYKEKVVGIYFADGDTQVRFYMNQATWDQLKQDLLHARDNWAVLPPLHFEKAGVITGYRIGNQLATMRMNLQGATVLSERRLMMNATGGADKPRRVSVAMKEQNLKDLVDDFHKIDDFLRQ